MAVKAKVLTGQDLYLHVFNTDAEAGDWAECDEGERDCKGTFGSEI